MLLRSIGENWYLAAISDRDDRPLPVPLKFLGKDNWKVTLWEDAPDSDQNVEHLVKEEKTVRPSDTLQLKLAPSGGTVAIFSAAR
jgi:alpha-glucosidase